MYFKVWKIILGGTISSIPCHEVLVCNKYSIFSCLTLFLFFFFFVISRLRLWKASDLYSLVFVELCLPLMEICMSVTQRLLRWNWLGNPGMSMCFFQLQWRLMSLSQPPLLLWYIKCSWLIQPGHMVLFYSCLKSWHPEGLVSYFSNKWNFGNSESKIYEVCFVRIKDSH